MMKNVAFKPVILLVISSLSVALLLSQSVFSYQQQGKPPLDLARDRQLSQTAFTYQGELKDINGLANGVFEFRFALYSAQTGGDELGSNTFGDVALTNGLFAVELDFGRSVNESWLEIAVRLGNSPEPFTVLSPRQKLTPTPSAIFARHETWSLVGMAVGVAESVAIDLPTDTSAITDDVINEPDIKDADALKEVTPSEIADTGSESPAAKAAAQAGSGWVDDGSVVRLETSTDWVGIGTTNPGAKLEVARGNIAIGANQQMRFNGGRDAFWYTGVNTASSPARLEFSTFNGGSRQIALGGKSTEMGPFEPKLVVDTFTGNVGIGANQQFRFNGVSDAFWYMGLNRASSPSRLEISTFNGGPRQIALGGKSSATAPFEPRLVVNTQSGGVGIGTTNPSALFHVVRNHGNAGLFENTSTGNSFAPLRAVTNGVGPAFEARHTGAESHAGRFEVTNPSNRNAALFATTNGMGPAARIEVPAGTNNDNYALTLNHSGSGPTQFGGALSASVGTRNGTAATFTHSNPARNRSDTAAVVVISGTANRMLVVENQNLQQAAEFKGRVDINGRLTKSSGSFKIDHPLDPENKYLYHSFVESPDMMNIYNGNVVLDEAGEARVDLPEWFEALNRDFRYQLTSIETPAPNLHIAAEISSNRFKIAGGKPGTKVSWQVTGIRHDPYAEANRIPIEEEKPINERGYYLHPREYGQPKEKGVEWGRDPEWRRRLNKATSGGAQ